MVRAMLKTANMPGDFWGEAVVTAVYILNHAPTCSLDGRTPYEVWHGKKPSVRHLCTFGCVVYVKDTKPHLVKLDARGKKGVFIGYETGSKAYRVFDPMENQVHLSRDVAFDENNFRNWENNVQEEQAGDPFMVEYQVTGLGEEVANTPGVAAPVTPIVEPESPPIAHAPNSA
jgi:hypothetical protein